MDFDGIIAGRGNPGDKAKALTFLYDFIKVCGAERDRIVESCPGMYSRKTKRQRAAFADHEHARAWVLAIYERISRLEGRAGTYTKPTSA